MWLFGRKQTMTCQEFADKFAPQFTNATVKSCEEVLDQQVLIQSDKEMDRKESLKELFLFNFVSCINGCRLSMKQDAIHFEFVRAFATECGSNLVEQDIFTSTAEFEQLAKVRLSEYLKALKSYGDENILGYELGQKFLVNVGCSPNTIGNLHFAIASFMKKSIATKEMFDDLQKSYHLKL